MARATHRKEFSIARAKLSVNVKLLGNFDKYSARAG